MLRLWDLSCMLSGAQGQMWRLLKTWNTKDMFLVEGNPDIELEVTGFCDASWQCDKDDTKSQTGYVFVVNGGAVDWKSKKQKYGMDDN
uniref:Retrotransposon protein, putative, Ty1-copia subclass n=1 Tax=Tanacetum cinerariifolium TaxID=118510 RepID=A0A699SY24_TANCI|nr:retrotransposon protein, putative, Ty1-copia subclass [Tanacetum cinerariifolium]